MRTCWKLLRSNLLSSGDSTPNWISVGTWSVPRLQPKQKEVFMERKRRRPWKIYWRQNIIVRLGWRRYSENTLNTPFLKHLWRPLTFMVRRLSKSKAKPVLKWETDSFNLRTNSFQRRPDNGDELAASPDGWNMAGDGRLVCSSDDDHESLPKIESCSLNTPYSPKFEISTLALIRWLMIYGM